MEWALREQASLVLQRINNEVESRAQRRQLISTQ